MSDTRIFRGIRGCTVLAQLDHDEGQPCLSLIATRDSDGLALELRILGPNIGSGSGHVLDEASLNKQVRDLTEAEVDSLLKNGNVFRAFDIVDGKVSLDG